MVFNWLSLGAIGLVIIAVLTLIKVCHDIDVELEETKSQTEAAFAEIGHEDIFSEN